MDKESLDICQNIMNGKVDALEGCHTLVNINFNVDLAKHRHIRNLVGVYSQIDDLDMCNLSSEDEEDIAYFRESIRKICIEILEERNSN